MALINCRKCAKRVSDQAIACPQCGCLRLAEGFKLASGPSPALGQAKTPGLILGIILAIVVFFLLLLAIGLFTDSTVSDSTDEKERAALTAEGTFLTSEMERANREHDWSRVSEIRQRNRDFLDHSSDYLIRHPQ